MPRTVVHRQPAQVGAGAAAREAAKTPEADGLPEKLVKYVPAETIALVVTATAAIGTHHKSWLVAIIVIAFVGTPGYLWTAAPKDQAAPRWYFYFLADVALAAWLLATSGPIQTLVGIKQDLAGVVLAATAFLVPIVDSVLNRLEVGSAGAIPAMAWAAAPVAPPGIPGGPVGAIAPIAGGGAPVAPPGAAEGPVDAIPAVEPAAAFDTGNWASVAEAPFSIGVLLLLTDGSILGLEANGARATRLVPDEHGVYASGTWVVAASMTMPRLYYATAVLNDGRVLVAGGEYTGTNAQVDTTACEVYDPAADAWEAVQPPDGWGRVGDAPSCTLPSGRVLIGNIDNMQTALFDPATNTFALGPEKRTRCDEESWVLLPDGSVLTVACNDIPHAERCVDEAGEWIPAGQTPVPLVQQLSQEIGPGVLLTNGRAFFAGATGATAIYTPPANLHEEGNWEAGPTFPTGASGQPMQAKDAPACLLPNGKLLLTAGPAAQGTAPNGYPGPTRFFLYDGPNELHDVSPASPPQSGPYTGCLLVAPSGEVLFSSQSRTLLAYTPGGAPQRPWRPEITEAPANIERNVPTRVEGRQLNGLSQACAYGDDVNPATNYPIARLRLSGGRIAYCTTKNHSTMGVATGAAVHSTEVTVPPGTPLGAAQLEIVANGIASAPREITVT